MAPRLSPSRSEQLLAANGLGSRPWRRRQEGGAPNGGSQPPPEYLVIGHVSRDVFGGKERPGGAVLYAGVTASRLGRRVGIVTRAEPGWISSLTALSPRGGEEGSVEVACGASERTTAFRITAGPGGRSLRLLARAADLGPEDIPPAWRRTPLVHLAPIAGEVPAGLALEFPTARVFATAQGWLRRMGEDGTVKAAPEALQRLPLDSFAAIVVSEEDLAGHEALVRSVAARVPVVAVTRGREGCSVYDHGQAHQVPAYPVSEVDSTGAGDVFAAALFIRLAEGENPVASAGFAACAAALSVEREGFGSIPTRGQVIEALAS